MLNGRRPPRTARRPSSLSRRSVGDHASV